MTHRGLADAVVHLTQNNEDLACLYRRNGVPPLWQRPEGFETLVRIILEQQVSLVSANAMYARLCQHIDPLTPRNILQAGAASLRQLGVTRQKSSYFIDLATAVEEGWIDFDQVGSLSDQAAMVVLTSVRGIGPWTAQIYLLMALCRPDVWPTGDVALATGMMQLRALAARPTTSELDEFALRWRPYRAVAARMLWHDYLLRRKKQP